MCMCAVCMHMCICVHVTKLNVFIRDMICFLQNFIVIVLFELSFLSGGIANVVFTIDNADLRSDLCGPRGFYSLGSGICRAFDRVVATEAASGVS